MTTGEWISGSVCMYLSQYLAAPNPGDRNVSSVQTTAMTDSYGSYFCGDPHTVKNGSLL